MQDFESRVVGLASPCTSCSICEAGTRVRGLGFRVKGLAELRAPTDVIGISKAVHAKLAKRYIEQKTLDHVCIGNPR